MWVPRGTPGLMGIFVASRVVVGHQTGGASLRR